MIIGLYKLHLYIGDLGFCPSETIEISANFFGEIRILTIVQGFVSRPPGSTELLIFLPAKSSTKKTQLACGFDMLQNLCVCVAPTLMVQVSSYCFNFVENITRINQSVLFSTLWIIDKGFLNMLLFRARESPLHPSMKNLWTDFT